MAIEYSDRSFSRGDILTRKGLETGILKMPDVEKGPFNDLVVVAGPSASGKTFLSDGSAAGIAVEGFGDILGRALGVDKDYLKHLSVTDIQEHYPEVAQYLLNQQPLIVTSHPVYKQGGEWRFNPDLYRMINPRMFVVVTASPETIQMFRNADAVQRDRLRISDEELLFEQRQTIDTLLNFSELNGNGVAVVRNDLQNTIQNIAFLESLFKASLQLYG